VAFDPDRMLERDVATLDTVIKLYDHCERGVARGLIGVS
jgi:hypothetical protein